LVEGVGSGSILAGFFTFIFNFPGFSAALPAARFPIAQRATVVTAEQWVRDGKQDHSNLIGWCQKINHIQFADSTNAITQEIVPGVPVSTNLF